MKAHRPLKANAGSVPAGMTRRELLCRGGMGFGALALADLMAQAGLLAATQEGIALNPLAARRPPLPAKARRVIHLFLNGGVSHVDTFDPKPALEKYAGQTLPIENPKTEFKTGAAFPSPFKFSQRGQSGLEISELFPHVAESADDLCVIRSMHADLPNHEPSLLLMNCGEARLSRPSVGSWVTYGLGSENENLPGFIAMCPSGYPIQESQNWHSSFLPGAYQGTFIDSQHTDVQRLIENIRNESVTPAQQREQLDLLLKLNELHRGDRPEDAQLESRIQTFELAYRMQIEAAGAFDISQEPESIRAMYGPGVQGRQMLIARRLVERGVRFVQVWSGAGQPWDNHENIAEAHAKLAKESDQPIGALVKDLKQRGMLDDTLVLCSGEFGRTPTVQVPQGTGRDHNHYGFSLWLAGGGVKGGHVHGATDEFGYKAVEDPVHVHDLHATMLHLLGFDHETFTYRYAGRDFRLTDVHGHVVRDILA
ncbi:MAG: DUF1501 domain-containing protein [Pirellulales bacterium]